MHVHMITWEGEGLDNEMLGTELALKFDAARLTPTLWLIATASESDAVASAVEEVFGEDTPVAAIEIAGDFTFQGVPDEVFGWIETHLAGGE